MTCDFLDLPWDCVEQGQAYCALEMAELMVFAHVRSLGSTWWESAGPANPSSHLCAEAVGHPLTTRHPHKMKKDM